MCKISDYAPLYAKTEGALRYQGLNPKTPGFEILKVAIVVYKVQGIKEGKKELFFDDVQSSMTSPIPSINPVVTDRHPVEQWILEALREQGIEDSVMSFVKDVAAQI